MPRRDLSTHDFPMPLPINLVRARVRKRLSKPSRSKHRNLYLNWSRRTIRRSLPRLLSLIRRRLNFRIPNWNQFRRLPFHAKCEVPGKDRPRDCPITTTLPIQTMGKTRLVQAKNHGDQPRARPLPLARRVHALQTIRVDVSAKEFQEQPSSARAGMGERLFTSLIVREV